MMAVTNRTNILKRRADRTTEGERVYLTNVTVKCTEQTLRLKPTNRKYTVLLGYNILHSGGWLRTFQRNILPLFQNINKPRFGILIYTVYREETLPRLQTEAEEISLPHD
jgi:hypothetical protein